VIAVSGEAWLAGPVAVPLTLALIAFVAGRRLHANLAAALTVTLPLACLPLTWLVFQDGPHRHLAGGWEAPLGIGLRADGLGVAMLWLTAVIGLAVSTYAAAYFGNDSRRGLRFWPLWFLLLAGLNAAFLTDDLFNAYVTLELITLTAIPLIALGGGPALGPATRYLLLALLGSLLYLLGIALLYGVHGRLDMTALAMRLDYDPATTIAVALITAGLAIKAALFPLHGWLPPAHGEAPSVVSAALSALVVKAPLYLLLRLWSSVLPPAPMAVLTLLGTLGALAVLYGALQALRQRRLKVLVAYSTVAQLGYALMALPIATLSAWSAAIIHLLAHGLAKAALFMAAGNLIRVLGHDRIDDLTATGWATRSSLFAFGVAGASLAGLPPSGGFLAKWYLIQAALAGGQWWWALVALAGGLLAAAYVFRVLAQAFPRADAPPPEPAASLPRIMAWLPMLLALASLALGFAGVPVLALLRIGAPASGAAAP